MELAGDQAKPLNMFRLATGLFYKTSEKSAIRIDLAEQLFKFRGGKVKDTFDEHLSHIFIDNNGFDADRFLKDLNVTKDAFEKIRIVSCEWIVECFNKGTKCNAKPFRIVL